MPVVHVSEEELRDLEAARRGKLTRVVSVRMSEEEVDELDRRASGLSHRRAVSRGEVIRRAVFQRGNGREQG